LAIRALIFDLATQKEEIMFGTSDEGTILATLNSTLNDSINGYRESAGHTEAPQLKQLFQEMAEEREAVATELRAEADRLGGEPDTDGSTAGFLHQRFLDLKSALTGRDDQAIVNEVERGEDYLKEKFEAALESDALSGESRMVVERVYQSVRKGHDRVIALKHSMAGE
jgi:uncharacterized protein (TIGR02284 family)